MNQTPRIVVPPGRNEYLEYIQAKRELAVQIGNMRVSLADAEMQHELLDIDQQIAEATFVPSWPQMPAATVEQLSKASEACQKLEQQIAELDKFCGNDKFGETMAPVINSMIRPMLEGQLQEAEQYRDLIQQALENQEAEAQ